MTTRIIRAYSDGACNRDERYMHIGYYAEDPVSGQVLFCGDTPIRDDDGSLRIGTCNAAEFYAIQKLIDLLKEYISKHADEAFSVTLHTDSLLAYNQIKGNWKINSDELFQFVRAIRKELKELGWEIKHIPREENRMADSLASEGVVQAFGGDAGNINFSRLSKKVVSGERLVSHEMLSRIFHKEIPLYRDTIVKAIDKGEILVAVEAIDIMMGLIEDAKNMHITAYMNKMIESVTTRIVEDFNRIKALLLTGEVGEAKEMVEYYTFRNMPEGQEVYVYEDTTGMDEIDEMELCEQR